MTPFRALRMRNPLALPVGTYGAFDPSYKTTGFGTLSGSNRILTADPANNAYFMSTDVKKSGKWYFEVTVTARSGEIGLGIVCPALQPVSGKNMAQYGYGAVHYASTGDIYFNTSQDPSGPHMQVGVTPPGPFTTGAVIGYECDFDYGYYRVRTASGVPTTGIIPTGQLCAPCAVLGAGASVVSFNFGQAPFVYTPTAGHVAWTATPLTKSGRYWRLLQGAGTYEQQLIVSEWGLRLTPGGANQIGSGSVSARDYEPSYPPGNAVDGNPATDFASLWNRPLYHWLQYDFGVGVSKAIREMTFTKNGQAGNYATSIMLAYSNDGAEFYPAMSAGPLTWVASETKTFTFT